MAEYTQLNRDDIQKISQQYNLSVETFASIDGGAANSSFLLHGEEQKYVLTVFDDTPLADVLNLGRLLVLLKKHKFPTTRLLTTTQGETAVIYNNKPVIIKEYISGKVEADLHHSILRQIGQTMAKLHHLPVPNYLPSQHPYGRQIFKIAFARNIDPIYEAWLAQKTNYLNQHIPKNLPTGLIHSDLFYDNVLVEDNQFKAILDFEGACHYYKVFDIGMAIVGLCYEDSVIHLDKAQAFVAGYQTMRQLEPNEETAVQLMAEYGAIATSYWRFWKYRIDTPMPDKANKHWQMANLAKHIEAIPASEFMQQVVHPS